MLQKFITFTQNQQEKITLLMNYLFVLYAFTLPMAFHTEKIIFKLIFILFLFSGDLKAKLLFAIKNKIFQAMLLFLSVYIIWIIGSEHKALAIAKLKIFSQYIFLFPIYLTSIQEEFKEKILNSFLFAIFISELVSFSMLFNLNLPLIHYTGFGSYVPFFYTYSQYAILLIISLSIALYIILSKKLSKLLYIIYSIFFIISTVNVFILDSKLGYILYFISTASVLIYILKDKISKTKVFLFFIMIAVSYSLAFNFSATFAARIHNIGSDIQSAYKEHIFKGSTGKRIAWNIYGIKVYLEHPLLGVGTFDHIDLVSKEIQPLQPKHVTHQSDLLGFNNTITPVMSTLHSEYLDHLVQFGPIGLLVLFYLFYTIYKTDSTTPTLQMLKYLLLINIILYIFVNYFFILSQLAKIFFFLIALSIAGYKGEKR